MSIDRQPPYRLKEVSLRVNYRLFATALIVVAAFALSPAIAADAPVGTVDVAAVFQGYSRTETSNAELESFRTQLIRQLQTVSENKLLDENESKELFDLLVKPSPSDKDKARLTELQEREKTLDKELKDLQAKKEPTEQEKARLKELQDRGAKTDESVAKQKEESEQQFETKKEQLSQGIRDDILKAIENIAKSKGMTVVVDKMAVLYGGTDITEPVLEKLNGKKK